MLTPKDFMRAALGKRGYWAIARLGPVTWSARRDRSCQLRWDEVRLTLFVAARRGSCSKGLIIGGAEGGRQRRPLPSPH